MKKRLSIAPSDVYTIHMAIHDWSRIQEILRKAYASKGFPMEQASAIEAIDAWVHAMEKTVASRRPNPEVPLTLPGTWALFLREEIQRTEEEGCEDLMDTLLKQVHRQRATARRHRKRGI